MKLLKVEKYTRLMIVSGSITALLIVDGMNVCAHVGKGEGWGVFATASLPLSNTVL